MASAEGVVSANRSRIEDALLSDGEPLTLGYKPTLPFNLFSSPYSASVTWMVLWDIEAMLTHPVVTLALQNFRGAIANAEFEVKANNQQVADFALEQVESLWGSTNGLAIVQLGYEYGWQAAEVMYRQERHKLHFDKLISFHARDSSPLTRNRRYVGIRVRNGTHTTGGLAGDGIHADSKSGIGAKLELWGPRKTPACDAEKCDIPAKGFWYAHNPKHHRWWGRTQLHGAWHPWRRLAGPSGAENTTDMGVYRFAFKGPVVRYPGRDMPRPASGGGYESARDRAREFAESAKAGVSVALPSDRDKDGNYLWDAEWPDHTLNVDSLVNYLEYLKKEIAAGIGVPPELIEASDVGSGYSGRAIPMESFLMSQQRIADAIVATFVEQVLDPLLLWNFGRTAWAKVRVKSLLATKSKNTQGGGPPQPPPNPGRPEGAPGRAGAAGQGAAPPQPPSPPPGGGGDDPLAALLGGMKLSTVATLEGGGWSAPIRNTPSRGASGATPAVRRLARELAKVRSEPWRLSEGWLAQFAKDTASLSQREYSSFQRVIGVNQATPGAVTEEGRRVEAALNEAPLNETE